MQLTDAILGLVVFLSEIIHIVDNDPFVENVQFWSYIDVAVQIAVIVNLSNLQVKHHVPRTSTNAIFDKVINK